MAIPFLGQLIIGVVMLIGAYIFAPKPKQPKPPSLDDLEAPTSEAGRPIPVIMGSVTIKGLNVLYSGDKSRKTRKVKSGKK